MRDLILLLVRAVATILRVVQPGGVRAVVAESVLIKQSIIDTQSLSSACSESAHPGSLNRWILFSLDWWKDFREFSKSGGPRGLKKRAVVRFPSPLYRLKIGHKT